MTEEYREDDKSNEPAEDQSMAGAFDFDVPDGDPDDLSDLSDDDDSAQKPGDDDSSAGGEGDEDAADKGVIDPKLLVRVGRMNLSDEDTERVLALGNSAAISGMLDLLESNKKQSSSDGATEEEVPEWFEMSEEAAEDIAPELVEVLKSMTGTTKKAVEQLLGQMSTNYDSRVKAMDQRLAEQGIDAFDDAVETLGKDWEPMFGKEGKTESGHERNLERLRKAVFSDEYKGSVARRVKNAVNDMFVEHKIKLANDAKVKKAKNRQRRMIGQPSQRSKGDAGMTPRQTAVANASAFMKEKGMHPEQTDSIDYTDAL